MIWNDLPDDAQFTVIIQNEVENLSLCKSISPLVSGFHLVFIALIAAMSLVI